MRADRLLNMLMLLQTRGRMSARQLAKELEVSERTVYRDAVALSAAGVPVYAETGRDGGYTLVDSYRTSLTGLNEGEVRALFMLSIPAPLAQLGVDQELKSALLKLAAALPASRRGAEEQVRQRFHLDSTWWQQGDEPVPHLQAIQQAVWGDQLLQLVYHALPFLTIEQLVEPYGLVAKAGAWYLVYACAGRWRALRVSELLDARLVQQTFAHSPGFNLAAFWESWCAEQEESRLSYIVTVRVSPELFPYLPAIFGRSALISPASPADEQGWVRQELAFESLFAARQRLLGLGRAVEVLSPRPLRLSVQDFARQIVGLYEGEEGKLSVE